MGDTVRVEHNFYVNEITNYPKSEMFTKASRDKCGKNYAAPQYIFNNEGPDKFYIHYTEIQ